MFIDSICNSGTLLLIDSLALGSVADGALGILHCVALLLGGDTAYLVIDGVALLFVYSCALVLIDSSTNRGSSSAISRWSRSCRG